ncbi:hypothetical protein RF11_10618 [Thelohanellus kitauei]|uniref:Tc1-like transposase DDE domain-containing protein n=1 Tax=Thelohanellus kitauei TaxID=669202 RepID=A0A0C2N9W0_THEKT|nr:hypothetical protein RF11_10618 [Thelohanellus kitauei]
MSKEQIYIMNNMTRQGCYTKIEEGQEARIVPKSDINYIREEISQNIVSIVSENNDSTLHKNFTRKRIIPIERNSESNLNTRPTFCRVINDILCESLIFIDETDTNFHLNPYYGYGPTGMTPTLNEPANRGQNISCLLKISISGGVSFCIEDGAINKNIETQKFYSLHNDILQYLPQYSPQCNSLEECFSLFKKLMKRWRNEICTRQLLGDDASQILEADRQNNMSGYFRHTRRFTEIGFR